jgi:hypothetical protein
MGALDPILMSIARNKMISFRLSAGDYERLREYRAIHGGRSISELARAAVAGLVSNLAPSSEALETRVNELEDQLRRLALELEHIKQTD